MILFNLTQRIFALLIISVFAANIGHANELVSFSISKKVTDESGVVYLQRAVNCKDELQGRAIHKGEGSRKWCVLGSNTECFNNKLSAAKKACSLGVWQRDTAPLTANSKVASTNKAPKKNEKTVSTNSVSTRRQALNNELNEIDAKIETIRLRYRKLEAQADVLGG